MINQGVAVIIAAYNASATIARAVKSALAEPEVVEVIVVDDASTDGTADCARNADNGNGRLKVLAQKQNAGPSAARNRAMRASSAPWITVLDSDDFYMPGRIKALLQYAKNTDFVADDMWQVPEHDANGPRQKLLGLTDETPQSISFQEFVLSNAANNKRQRAELGFIKPLMRRDFLAAHHITYQEQMRLGEDYELYARSLAKGARMLLVPAKGYVSVVRANSLSGNHSINDLFQLRECDKSLQKIAGLKKADQDALRSHYLSIDCRLQWRRLIDAIKKRDIATAIACFLRPWPVPFYLMQQLCGQAVMRTAKQLRTGTA